MTCIISSLLMVGKKSLETRHVYKTDISLQALYMYYARAASRLWSTRLVYSTRTLHYYALYIIARDLPDK